MAVSPSRVPLVLRLRCRPPSIRYRPLLQAVNGRLLIEWCHEQIARRTQRAVLLVGSPADCRELIQRGFPREALIEADTPTDIDAVLAASHHSGLQTIVWLYPEAVLGPLELIGELEQFHALNGCGLTIVNRLAPFCGPEVIDVSALRQLLELLGSAPASNVFRVRELFALAEAAGLDQAHSRSLRVGRLHCDSRVATASIPAVFESEREVSLLRSLVSTPTANWATCWRAASGVADREAKNRLHDLGSRRPRHERRERSQLRVMFVSNPSAFTGAESSICNTARALATLGVQTAAVIAFEGVCADVLASTGCVVYCPNREFAAANPDNWNYLARALSEFEPDVVHYNGNSGVSVLELAAIMDVPVVCHVHTSMLPSQEIIRWADTLIAVSPSIASDLIAAGVDERKVVCIPNGVDTQHFRLGSVERQAAERALGISSGPFTILTVARWAPEKRLDLAVRVVGALRHAGLDVRAIIAGESHPGQTTEAEVTALVRELQLNEHVAHVGFLHDVRVAYAAADVLLCPSDREGFSMVILEAMASGLPIVATAVGGAITALSEGRGLLVAPGDVEGMATALKNCHDDRAGALERARLAQAYVQQELTYMQNGQSLVRLYRSLAER